MELSTAYPGSRQSVGTRFQLYPQSPTVSDYQTPETVWISTPPGQLLPGPADHRSYVRDPLSSKEPYEFPYMPPFVGDVHTPAVADAEGHFDSIPTNSRQFLAAHAFGCVSRVLDIWESYLGHRIAWHFSETYERLEIIPYLAWDNAQSGYGYLELGIEPNVTDRKVPYALNFDVIAHEVGHAILFSECGFPPDGISGADFAPIHEANADTVSLLSFMHFDSGLDRLLRHCSGNVLVLNELNRIAELTGDRQIRLACNSRKLSEVSAEVHDRARPLLGALFDTLVDRYHGLLVAEGLADERLMSVDIRGIDEETLQGVSRAMARAYKASPFRFKSALENARDDVAMVLARAWGLIDASEFDFRTFSARLMQAADRRLPPIAAKLEENLAWRELL